MPTITKRSQATGLLKRAGRTDDAELARMVDAGWRAFWQRRHRQPPAISRNLISDNGVQLPQVSSTARKVMRWGSR